MGRESYERGKPAMVEAAELRQVPDEHRRYEWSDARDRAQAADLGVQPVAGTASRNRTPSLALSPTAERRGSRA